MHPFLYEFYLNCRKSNLPPSSPPNRTIPAHTDYPNIVSWIAFISNHSKYNEGFIAGVQP